MTKFRRLYVGENPMISEQELVKKGIILPLKTTTPENMIHSITASTKEWLEGLGVTILRMKRK